MILWVFKAVNILALLHKTDKTKTFPLIYLSFRSLINSFEVLMLDADKTVSKAAVRVNHSKKTDRSAGLFFFNLSFYEPDIKIKMTAFR